jgi:hypothetical protein
VVSEPFIPKVDSQFRIFTGHPGEPLREPLYNISARPVCRDTSIVYKKNHTGNVFLMMVYEYMVLNQHTRLAAGDPHADRLCGSLPRQRNLSGRRSSLGVIFRAWRREGGSIRRSRFVRSCIRLFFEETIYCRPVRSRVEGSVEGGR